MKFHPTPIPGAFVIEIEPATDLRGIYAHITPEGQARWEAARPTHRAVLAEQLPANAPATSATP